MWFFHPLLLLWLCAPSSSSSSRLLLLLLFRRRRHHLQHLLRRSHFDLEKINFRLARVFHFGWWVCLVIKVFNGIHWSAIQSDVEKVDCTQLKCKHTHTQPNAHTHTTRRCDSSSRSIMPNRSNEKLRSVPNRFSNARVVTDADVFVVFSAVCGLRNFAFMNPSANGLRIKMKISQPRSSTLLPSATTCYTVCKFSRHADLALSRTQCSID